MFNDVIYLKVNPDGSHVLCSTSPTGGSTLLGLGRLITGAKVLAKLYSKFHSYKYFEQWF